MTGNEIRQAFLDYFAERGHQVVPSAPTVPQGDATLMFTNAGMVPFKRVFTGEESRDYNRAVSSQRCMRVSGKHNDLEEVGRSPSHQTLFEMLGNFSFGDYFKREAIEYGWDFLTNIVGLAPERLVVSVHKDDQEAYELWRDEIGLAEERIFRLDDAENFWQMGDTGPCGPCSEIHLITDPEIMEKGGDPSGPGFLELWNLVFMQFEQAPDGTRKELPSPSVDTGLGLERIATVMQGVTSNYDTDLFRPIMARVQQIAGYEYGSDPDKDVSIRVVTDHVRACTFLIGDGVLPSNAGRGYVLRRVLRRAARHGVLLGIDEPFLFEVADTVIQEMGAAFPEIRERRDFIRDTIRKEEERFLKTLGRGLALLDEQIVAVRRDKHTRLSGDVVFQLYDTFGFPTDLTQDILRGHGLDYDQDRFDECMREQAERARAAWKGSGEAAPAEVYNALANELSSEFVGYEQLAGRSKISAILVAGERVQQASEGERVEVIVPTTPFYAESGGQVGDVGKISTESGAVEVEDVQRPVEGLIVHTGCVGIGTIRSGEDVQLEVDREQRAATFRNHSGTHLFQWALRQVLGSQVTQAGSLVGPERLRFDFTHDNPLTGDEIREVEDLVNGLIFENIGSSVETRSYPDAIAAGAIAMFSEKYGDEVRVVTFGPSVELCGGTHASATGDIGCFRIIGQSAIGAGVRRVEAQTGFGVIQQSRRDESLLREASGLLRASPADLPERISKMLERQRELERELEKTRAQMRRGGSGDPLQSAREVAGVKLIAAEVEDANPKELRQMIDELKQRLGSGLVLLAVRQNDKVSLALGVTSDLTNRFKAGALVKEISTLVGGSGGGRPDFAQAGGNQPDGVPQALERFVELIESAAG
ncbi:MAG: alanine--tRNA ligase [bacterium]|nr:alanine--tRNA ligase [bacterium]